jgi:hypothetical protein
MHVALMNMTEEEQQIQKEKHGEPLQNKYPARKHKNDSQNKEPHFIGSDLEAECCCESTEVKALFFIKCHEPYMVSQFWT